MLTTTAPAMPDSKRTSEYVSGFYRAMNAADRVNYGALSPSSADREEFNYAWPLFWAGWQAGLRRWNWENRQ